MGLLATVVDEALDRLAGRGFDLRLVRGRVIDAGPLADRARGLARRLNAVRSGRPKEPVVVWSVGPGAPGHGFAAVTRRGPWIYVADALVKRLSDDGLAFVLAHEMAHHDLGHLTPTLMATSLMGHAQRLELMADAEGLRLMRRAGFDPAGALEALSPELWTPEEEPPEPPSEGLAAWLDRFRRSHPSMRARHDALAALLEADPG